MKSLIGYAVFIFLIVFLSIVALEVVSVYDPDTASKLAPVLATLLTIGSGAWSFARPLLQLIVILIVLEWFAGRFGVSLKGFQSAFVWNVQALIAVAVVLAFCIAALGGIGATGELKDIALVVVGFYFGTRRLSVEPTPSPSSTPTPTPASQPVPKATAES